MHTLAKVHHYAVTRDGEHIDIRVYEVLEGANTPQFIASPWQPMFLAKRQFEGSGETLEAALKECLAKIKDTPKGDVFELPTRKEPVS